jgi:hypothetical protein
LLPEQARQLEPDHRGALGEHPLTARALRDRGRPSCLLERGLALEPLQLDGGQG